MERLADLPDIAKKVIFGVLATALGVLVVFANLDDSESATVAAPGTEGAVLTDGEVVAPQETLGAVTPSTGETDAEVISILAPVDEKSLREAGERAVDFVRAYVEYDWREDAEERALLLQSMAAETNTINTSGVGSLYAQDREVVTTVDIVGAAPTLISPSTVVFAVQSVSATTTKDSDEPVVTQSVLAVSMTAQAQQWKVISIEVAGQVTSDDETGQQGQSASGPFQDGGAGGQ